MLSSKSGSAVRSIDSVGTAKDAVAAERARAR